MEKRAMAAATGLAAPILAAVTILAATVVDPGFSWAATRSRISGSCQ
ncbi:hypothetical protein ACFQH2_05510 [Natronoarchaeum sp. GCM10025703]